MNEKALNDLARRQLTPRAVETFTAVNAWREIARLEAILGLPVGNPIYHMRKSKDRLKELNTMLAEKRPDLVTPPHVPTIEERAGVASATAPAAIAPVIAAAIPAVAAALSDAGTIGLAEFYRLGVADRAQAARDGRTLSKSSFDKLTLASKSAWCVSGGRIEDDAPSGKLPISTAARSFGNS